MRYRYRNSKGRFCSREEWLRMGIKKIFIQWLKENGLYEVYRENVSKSHWWKDGKSLLIKTRHDYISKSFPFMSNVWVGIGVDWSNFLKENDLW